MDGEQWFPTVVVSTAAVYRLESFSLFFLGFMSLFQGV